MRRYSSSWLGAFSKLGFKRISKGRCATAKCPRFRSSRILGPERLEDRSMLAVLTVNVLTDTNQNDPNTDLSLREAIEVVNSNSLAGLSVGTERNRVSGPLGSNDTIQFTSGLTGNINLSLGEVQITRPLIIIGPGGNAITIDATLNDPTPATNNGDGSRIFNVNVFGTDTVDLRGLRLTGGDEPGTGGAVFSRGGNLIIQNSTLTGNFAGPRGGAVSAYGTLTILNSTITNNGAVTSYFGTGGGIAFNGYGMTITSSTISGNTARNTGGGISATASGDITLTNSNVTGNISQGYSYYGGGGGVLVSSANAFTMTGGSISNNSTYYGNGGGLNLNVSGSQPSGGVELSGVTISANNATNGAGISFSGSSLELSGSTVSGNISADRGGGVFVGSSSADIAFNNSNITGNRAYGSNSAGGGGVLIENANSLKITGGSVSNNYAYNGGNGGGLLLTVSGSQPNSGIELSGTTVSGNTASGSGGGMFATSGQPVKIGNAVVSNNSAITGNGGGLFLDLTGSLQLSGTTVANNTATDGEGGGLYLREFESVSAPSTITGSTFSNNFALGASGLGGGLRANRASYYGASPLVIQNSTFSANTASTKGGGVYIGDGGPSTLFTNVTITNNKSPDGAGLRSNDNVVLTNTIVSANRLVANTTPNNISGNVAGSYNLVGTGGNGGLVHGVTGNIVGVDNPQLGALTNNGGLTNTHLPSNTSPARNSGSPAFQFFAGDVDQRGGPRVLDGRIDMGSVETSGVVVPPAPAIGMADIVLLVDESGSSTDSESGWLANMLLALETEFVQKGFTSNRYGVVGFANAQSSDQFAYSYLLDGQLFGSAIDAVAATGRLVHTGGDEDGWDSLEHAVAEYDFRPGAAVHFILLSDEPRRTVVNTTLTPDDNPLTTTINESLLSTAIRPVIDARNATLTAITTSEFTADNFGDTVLGALANPNPLGPIHTSREFDPNTNNLRPNTTVDETTDVGSIPLDTLYPYDRLAWATGGSVWNDGVIRNNELSTPIVNVLTREFALAVSNRVIEQVTSRQIILPTKLVVGIDFGGTTSTQFPHLEPPEAVDPDPFTPGNQSTVLTVPGSTVIDNTSNSIPAGTEFAFRNARAADDGRDFKLKFGAAQGITNGTYQVELFFAEIGVEDRLFDVVLEGNTVLNNYSIANDHAKVEPIPMDTDGRIAVSLASTNTAIVKTFEVTVTDGQLNIDLNDVGGTEGPLLSALRILRELSVPLVTGVTVGRNGGPGYDFTVPGRVGSGEQLRTVPIGGVNQVSVTLSENVGFNAAAQTTVQNAFRLHNEATDQDVTIPFTFNWSSATRTGAWTFNQALPPAPYVLVMSDSVINADLVALDGNWINPTKLTQTSSDTFPSGDGDQGDRFEFFFTNLPADFNHDNIVNSTDLNIWKANFGRTVGVTQSDGDVDGDGFVNGNDFLKWQTQLGFDLRDWNAPGILMPTVTNLIVSGSSTQHAAYSLATAMASGTHQLTTIPVSGANKVTVDFSEDVMVNSDDLSVTDLHDPGRTFTLASFSSTARSATWTFVENFSAGAMQIALSSDVTDLSVVPHALDGAWNNQTNVAENNTDSFTSGDGTSAETFKFYVTSLPADFNHDNIVNSADQQIWSANFGTATGATQSMGDTDGDGDVDGNDFLEWQRELGMAINWQDWTAAGLIVDPVGPMTIRVSTLTDENDGNISPGDLSLREALALAAEYDGADVIEFDPGLAGGTINLHNNLDRLIVTSDVEIRGLGADQLTINAGGSSNWQGVFLVETGVEATIRDLKITGGYAVSGPPGTVGPFNGGGVYNRGELTLDRVLVTGNTSFYGSGIAQETAGASLTILNSTIDGNSGYSPGGGLYVGAGTVVVKSSTISNNAAVLGGGIYVDSTAVVTVSNSTLSGNSHEALRVAGTTSSVTVLNSTVTNNTPSAVVPAANSAGGITSPGNNVSVINSILAGNTGGDLNGTVNTASHHNLIGDGSEGNLVNATNSNLVGTTAAPINAYLTSLANNGGATKTHLPLPNSPALNGGDNTAASSLPLDQRGKSRLLGQYVDIGAVETSLLVSTLTDESDGNYSANDLSLREAIALAANTPGADLIDFDSGLTASGAATITLTYDGPDAGTVPDQLTIGSNVTIDGPAANLLSISGNNQTRVFEVSSGVAATIKDLRVTGGSASSGAGIYSTGSLTVDGSQIEGNSASSIGGGITASGGLTVSNSTINNNFGYGAGGGIYIGLTTTPALIVNSTISTNTANYIGGGIYDISSGANIVNSTVTANSAYYGGSGVYSSYGAKLTNSIVAANLTSADIYGTFNSSSSYNLIGFDNVLTNGIENGSNHNQVGGQSGAPALDPRLTALGYYGGTTKTHALEYDSTAIDAGDNSVAAAYALAYDQRGSLYGRVVDYDEDFDAHVDIGAFEVALLELFS